MPEKKASPILTVSLKNHTYSFTSSAFSGSTYSVPLCQMNPGCKKGMSWQVAVVSVDEIVPMSCFALLSCRSLLWSFFLLLWGDQEHRDLLSEQT